MMQPMSLLERNAPGFHYRVTYWPVDLTSQSSSMSVSSARVHRLYDWTASELVVPGQRTFQPFVIYVQAVNDEGDAPTSFLEKRIGYSGQDGMLTELACWSDVFYDLQVATVLTNVRNVHMA